uniref:Uncharacterized protein n=1 Tax=Vitis vinifera TaxID=29760 RepID=F6I6M2_VITVI
MEETCKLAVIGRPCKMCSNQVDFCKRISFSHVKAKGKAEAEDIMYRNRGISIETSPNDGTLCHPASSEIAAWPMARCGDLFRRKPINEKVDIWVHQSLGASKKEA